MVETEADTYNMNSSERKQSLKVSLINNQKVSMVITNKETQERYSSLLSLPKLKKLSKAFLTIKKAKDALNIIKEGIESGKIMLSEDPNDNTIEIKYSLKNFPPFNIKLKMEEPIQDNEEEQDVLPPKFDYKGNVEAEQKYGQSTENTTEYNKPDIQIYKNNIKHITIAPISSLAVKMMEKSSKIKKEIFKNNLYDKNMSLNKYPMKCNSKGKKI